MMHDDEIKQIIDLITYKPGWMIILEHDQLDPDGRLYIQIAAATPDSTNPANVVPWKSAKHYLSPFMCRQEIVGTVYHAIERAELHEMNEFFRYKGASIYNPHLDPDALAELARHRSSFNMRANSMSMTETQNAPT
jgi:hypothetical protein